MLRTLAIILSLFCAPAYAANRPTHYVMIAPPRQGLAQADAVYGKIADFLAHATGAPITFHLVNHDWLTGNRVAHSLIGMCLPRRRRLKRRGQAQDERVHHTVVSRTLPTRLNLTRCLACQRSYRDCSKPALRGASERLGKTQGHVRTYATLPLQDATQGRGRGIERDCEFPGTEPVGLQIDRGEKFPWMWRIVHSYQ